MDNNKNRWHVGHIRNLKELELYPSFYNKSEWKRLEEIPASVLLTEKNFKNFAIDAKGVKFLKKMFIAGVSSFKIERRITDDNLVVNFSGKQLPARMKSIMQKCISDYFEFSDAGQTVIYNGQ